MARRLPRGLVDAARTTRMHLWRASRHSGRAFRRATPAALDRSEVTLGFDYWSYLSDLQLAISAALVADAVPHVAFDDSSLPRPVVAVRRTDVERVRRALERHRLTRRCRLAQFHAAAPAPAYPVRIPMPLLPTATGLLVTRNLVAPDGRQLVRADWGVLIDLWDEIDGTRSRLPGLTPPAGSLVTRVPNGVVNHLSRQVWTDAQRAGHRLPKRPKPLLQVDQPIDLVYTWVDGSDPAWRARKAAALGGGLSALEHSADAAIEARFNSRDELRYSLRSVEMFANWIRHIWVVTDGQVPHWLRTNHSRLTVVDHRDIFTDPSALPSFNSHAIESQLHHIPGLSELYLYLNDDIMFGAPMRPEDFFHGNGLVKCFPSTARIDPRDPSADDVAVSSAAKNSRRFMERTMERTITNKLRHTPQPQSVSLLRAFEESHPEVFETVMHARFRQRSDYPLPSSLSQYYALARGRAVTGRIRSGYVDLANPLATHVLEKWLRCRDYDTLCVNDSGTATPEIAAALQGFFNEQFPLASQWELPSDHAVGPRR